jgi:hypothetical protein
MAEIVAATFAALAIGGEAAAAGGAAAGGAAALEAAAFGSVAGASSFGAAGGLASFLPSAGTALSILSGVATGASALAAIGKGVADRASKEAQATTFEERAISEGLLQASDADKARRALLDTVGKQAVGYAASGIDLSAGTVKIAQEQASEKAEQDLAVADTASKLRQASYRRQAAALRAEGSLAYTAGEIGAFGEIAKGGVQLLKRG